MEDINKDYLENKEYYDWLEKTDINTALLEWWVLKFKPFDYDGPFDLDEGLFNAYDLRHFAVFYAEKCGVKF